MCTFIQNMHERLKRPSCMFLEYSVQHFYNRVIVYKHISLGTDCDLPDMTVLNSVYKCS